MFMLKKKLLLPWKVLIFCRKRKYAKRILKWICSNLRLGKSWIFQLHLQHMIVTLKLKTYLLSMITHAMIIFQLKIHTLLVRVLSKALSLVVSQRSEAICRAWVRWLWAFGFSCRWLVGLGFVVTTHPDLFSLSFLLSGVIPLHPLCPRAAASSISLPGKATPPPIPCTYTSVEDLRPVLDDREDFPATRGGEATHGSGDRLWAEG
jgi:hypothetical protein